MAKELSYVCTECAGLFSKWMGQCSDCGAWNTIEKQSTAAQAKWEKTIASEKSPKPPWTPIKPARAQAVQNIAANKNTAYPQLARRLMQHITSDTSKRRFEQLGFQWVAGPPQP